MSPSSLPLTLEAVAEAPLAHSGARCMPSDAEAFGVGAVCASQPFLGPYPLPLSPGSDQIWQHADVLLSRVDTDGPTCGAGPEYSEPKSPFQMLWPKSILI
jgi:hypothetical protein